MLSRNKSILILIVCIILPLLLSAQTENWVFRYDGWNDWDEAFSIDYGVDGNIYAAGYSGRFGWFADFFVVSLSASGDTNWTYRYNGTAPDVAHSIVCGDDGNIYAAGYVTHSTFTVISLLPSGQVRWIYQYGNIGGNRAYSLTYGEDGNIYVAGYIDGFTSARDFAVISLTSAGDTNWVYSYNGSDRCYDTANDIIYGGDGNLYAAGYSFENGPMDRKFTVISLASDGNASWVYHTDDATSVLSEALSISYGLDGNVYAAGYTRGLNKRSDLLVVSLNSFGSINWVYSYNNPDDDTDYAKSIVCGSDGNIYVTGGSHGDGTGADIIVISLTAAGDTNWVYRYDGPGSFDDWGNEIIYGNDGNIYVAGQSWSGGTYEDFTVICLSPTGSEKWVCRYYLGSGDYDDEATSVVYGADGNIYAAGYLQGRDTKNDFTVISISPDVGVEEENPMIEKHNLTSTILTGSLMLPRDRNCRIFDITGRQIHTLDPAPGIYFIQVDDKIVRKVIKIK